MQDQLFKQEFIKQPNISRVAGFYGTQRTVELEKPTTLSALANPYSLISERQKQLMQTYAKIYGKLPTQKILVSPETFPQAYQEVMNRSSPNSIYQDYRQLAEALFNGGAFQRFPAANNFVAVAPLAINVAALGAQSNSMIASSQQSSSQMSGQGMIGMGQSQNSQQNQSLIMNGFTQSPMTQLQQNMFVPPVQSSLLSQNSSALGSQMFNRMDNPAASSSSISQISHGSGGASQMFNKMQNSKEAQAPILSSMEESKSSLGKFVSKAQGIDDMINTESLNFSVLKRSEDKVSSFKMEKDALAQLNGLREVKESLRQDMILYESVLQPLEQKRADISNYLRSKSFGNDSDQAAAMKDLKEIEMAIKLKRKAYDRTLDVFEALAYDETLMLKGEYINPDLMRQAAPPSINNEAFAHMSQPIQQIHQNSHKSMQASQASMMSQQSKVNQQEVPPIDVDMTAAFQPVNTSGASASHAMSQSQHNNSASQASSQGSYTPGSIPDPIQVPPGRENYTPGSIPDFTQPNAPGGVSRGIPQGQDSLMDSQAQQATSNAPGTRIPPLMIDSWPQEKLIKHFQDQEALGRKWEDIEDELLNSSKVPWPEPQKKSTMDSTTTKMIQQQKKHVMGGLYIGPMSEPPKFDKNGMPL